MIAWLWWIVKASVLLTLAVLVVAWFVVNTRNSWRQYRRTRKH